MDIVITAVLIGLFLIIVIWLVVSLGKSKEKDPPKEPTPFVSFSQAGVNRLTTKTIPVNNSVPAPSDKALINTNFNIFVHNLFSIADGKSIDMGDSIKNLVSVLCLSDTHKVRETLTEYVNELKVLMETYKEGSTVTQWVSDSSNTSGSCDIQSVSNADKIEQIRYLSSKLNGEFEGCVRFDGGHLGILFGILATNIISYKQNLNKGKVDQASIIRQRVMTYIEKVN